MKREDSDSEVANDEEPEGTSPPQVYLASDFSIIPTTRSPELDSLLAT
jgi:hypothetical protein